MPPLAVGIFARLVARFVVATLGAAVPGVAVSAITPVRGGSHVCRTVRAVCSRLRDFAAFAAMKISPLRPYALALMFAALSGLFVPV